MRNQRVIAAVVLALVTSGGAFASEIYKWTDEDGNVHYGDIPTAQSERVAIASKPTKTSRVRAETQSIVESQAKRAERTAAAAADDAAAAELRAEADRRAAKCTQYRQKLQKFVISRRLYREDENGERIYLDENETQAARNRVEGQVEEFCS